MSTLPDKSYQRIVKSYHNAYSLPVDQMDGCGEVREPRGMAVNLPQLVHTRAHALQESVRWGEPFIFFLLPNVLSWVVPVLGGSQIRGGLLGGAVMIVEDQRDRFETVNHLVVAGATRDHAEHLIDSLPRWQSGEQAQEAAEHLYALTRGELDDDTLLVENRKKALRQRQIAEEIHRQKRGVGAGNLLDEERALLALMKAGDRKGSRLELNKVMGALFSQSADMRLIRSHVVEMMGYLVRCAAEDSFQVNSLIEKNHNWMTAVIDARDFEELSNTAAEALDDFMRNITFLRHGRTNETVASILGFLSENFPETITLAQLSERFSLSKFRIAHLVKEVTGKTVIQHIHCLRIQESQRLLEQSDLSCADIAYEAGFGDQSYFIKIFRRSMGITPALYRNVYRDHDRSQERLMQTPLQTHHE